MIRSHTLQIGEQHLIFSPTLNEIVRLVLTHIPVIGPYVKLFMF